MFPYNFCPLIFFTRWFFFCHLDRFRIFYSFCYMKNSLNTTLPFFFLPTFFYPGEIINNKQIYIYIYIFFFFSFCGACSIVVPNQGLNLGPQQWKCWVLATGLPGNPSVCVTLDCPPRTRPWPRGLWRGSWPCFCHVGSKCQSLSPVRLFAAPCTVARQALLSMGFSRQEHWSRLPFPAPGYLPDPGIEPMSSVVPALQVDSLQLNHQGSPLVPWLGIKPLEEAQSLNQWAIGEFYGLEILYTVLLIFIKNWGQHFHAHFTGEKVIQVLCGWARSRKQDVWVQVSTFPTFSSFISWVSQHPGHSLD